ncbi:hypothetical protein [Sphingopyxis sp. P8]|uniref:hypothetical protein n=1 Tax=Sphingopyxis sp. P8 TaxID=2763256 RepID=UPI001D0B50C9|nr:hypothetical protein [Sphingopyxis sp. P8]
MSATSDFYLKQAEKCESDAVETALDNVRERNLRAAAAWRTMADKLILTEQTREKRVADAAREAELRDKAAATA